MARRDNTRYDTGILPSLYCNGIIGQLLFVEYLLYWLLHGRRLRLNLTTRSNTRGRKTLPSIKATVEMSGTYCRVGARWHVAKIYTRLGNKVRDWQPRLAFQKCPKVLQINKHLGGVQTFSAFFAHFQAKN